MAILTQAYTFDPRPHYPLVITAKRYWKANSPYLHDPSSLTLVFAHGTGFHKEQWEPTIDDLYELLGRNDGMVKVREMWTIDAPNHGDAAILNEKVLQWGYEPIFAWEEYARAIHAFLAGLGTGVDVDFGTRRVVGIGHSMGAASLVLAHGYAPRLKFESLILCDLMTMAPRYMQKTDNFLAQGAINRRDIWPSRDEAYRLLKARPAWKIWDDRVLRNMCDGMRGLPTADYPDKLEGITLKCSRKQETACYRDSLGASRTYGLLGPVAKQVPLHLIYGAVNDYHPQEVKDDVIKVAVGGMQHLASLSRVEGTGHLVVQTNPKGLAQKIFDALVTPSHPVSRL